MNGRSLDAADVAIVFIDLQEGIINVGTTTDPQRVRIAAAGLVDLATIFGLPAVAACVPTTSGTVAPLLAVISERLPKIEPLVRTNANAFADSAFMAALAATNRKTIVFAGVAIEIAVRLAALNALRLGFHAIIAVDACSGLDSRTEAATFVHLSAAGVELSCVATIAAQLAGDFTTQSGRAAMRALQSTLPEHGHHHAHDFETD